MIDPLEMYRRLTANDSHPLVAPALAVVRWSVVFYKQLQHDRAFVRGAAMAYASLIALVPMLLLVFGIIRLTGQDSSFDLVRGFLFETLLGNLQPVREVLEPGLLSVDLRALGGFGIAGLLAVSARIYLLVEKAYSDIFAVALDRPMMSRLLNFYLMITLGPVVILLTLMGTTEIASELQLTWLSGRLTLLMQFGLLLTALKAFPCTHVRWGPALAGAGVSTILLHFGGMLFPLYVRWFTSDDPAIVIYGSLGLIPVFLLWLFLLWIFVLLGVEVASVAQRFPSLVEAEFQQWEEARTVLRLASVDTALEVALRISRAFLDGRGPVPPDVLGEQCGIDGRALNDVLRVLDRGGIVVKAADGWIVSRPPDQIALLEVVTSWRNLTALRADNEDPVGAQINSFLEERLEGNLADAAVRWLPGESAPSADPIRMAAPDEEAVNPADSKPSVGPA